MAQQSSIEWTDAAPQRIRATAAARIGISLQEYDSLRAAGQKWCTGCKAWHSRDAFATDKSRTDGLTARCRETRNRQARTAYEPKPRPKPGRHFVSSRTGDEKQARRRVNYLIEAGLLPRPSTLPCTDCGHVWQPGGQRHEYDHHLGYDADHHERVQAVCTNCHRARTNTRGGTY